MLLSDLAIRRPVFATVVNLAMVIGGVIAFERLTVREVPDIDRPVVSVTTNYRGASAAIIESQVTQVIEDAIAGIEGISLMTSTSREESSSVSVEFNIERDIDGAANDVRDRVSRAIGRLPDEADPPTVEKSDSDARAIMWLTLTSDRLSQLELTDYADRFLVDRLSIVNGVASVRIGGERRYAMRIWLDKRALVARQLTVQDVEAALRRQNIELPSGRIESAEREIAIKTDSRLRTEDQFRNVVVSEQGGYFVRLGELARVEFGAEDERGEFRLDGHPAVGLGIVKQSKANTLDVATGVRDAVDRLQPSLPPGVRFDVAYDESLFITRAIEEVFIAISIALVMVISVNFLFLRTVRATIIPAVAIPVSIIASFMVLQALGFSINILTLLAFVLAIGLVVDDAIVVLENIHRRIEEGEEPLLAGARGARQIAFAVIATTVVLIAVFVPISFMEGETGRLFREFGIAVAAAVVFSAFVALSLTPMMCTKLLRKPEDEGAFYRATEKAFLALSRGYERALDRTLSMPVVVIAVGVGFSALALAMFQAAPKEFAPVEDRGIIFIPVTAPESASIDYTRRYVYEIESRLRPVVERGDARNMLTIVAPGFGRPGEVNRAFAILRLAGWDERNMKQQDITRSIFPALLSVPGVRAFAVNPSSLGRSRFGAPVQIVLGGPDYEHLVAWSDRIIARTAENPGLLGVESNYDASRPQLLVDIDRNRAADLGISVEDVGRTLETMLGSRFVTTVDAGGKLYNVVLQARPEDRSRPGDLSNIYVRSRTTEQLIPLANLVTLRETAGARVLNRVDRMRSVTISASLAPDVTLGEAVAFLERIASEELPASARVSWDGPSREFKETSSSLYFTFGLALLVVFLALAAQFESFIHPVIIMLTVPLAVTGALGAILVSGLSINIYSQIGIIMLIGLTAKNGILIVEFANQMRDQGLPVRDAIRQAAVTRLRPILMTSIATVFSAVPLVMGGGAGAESRQSLGVVVLGGMSFATVLSLFVVPVLYLLMARYTKPSGHIARRLGALEAGDTVSASPPAADPAAR
jgi:multidrug efflux pump